MASHEHITSAHQGRTGLNRRTLIRTGGHVAWTLPAVQLVTQAPAFAASGPPALTVKATPGPWTGASPDLARFNVTTTVTNNNTQPTSNLTVTYLLPAGVSATVTATGGWTVVSGNGSNQIVLQAPAQLGPNTTSAPFVVTFDPVESWVGNETAIQITANPGAVGTSGSTSATVAASPPVLTISQGTWVSQGSPPYNMNFSEMTITNTGFQRTVALQVVVTLPGTLPAIENPLTATTAAAGWSRTRTSERVITFTSSVQIGRGETVTFDPTIRTQGNVNSAVGSPTLQVVASNPGTTPGTGTATKVG